MGILLLCAADLSAAFLVFRSDTSEAFPGMPAEQRAYWEWVSTIGDDESAALDAGLSLLDENPDLERLYGRLAGLCADLERVGDCRAAFADAEPGAAALYRDAAQVRLDDELDAWKEIAAAPDLEPSLARVVVDEVRGAQDFELLEEIEADWQAALAADSSRAGASFGLGYAAVLRNEWDRATPYLERTAELRPHDSEPFREFGRMYFYTGDYDRFVEAMERCIENARRAYDVEEEIVNSGNLGLGYLQWKGDLERAGEMFETALDQADRLRMGSTMAIGAYRLANVRGRQHRYDEALALIDSAEVQYAEHAPGRIAELWALEGQILKDVYRLTEAEEILERAVASARANRAVPQEAGALLTLAQVREQMGRYDAAHVAADSALALATNFNVVDYMISARAVLGEMERSTGNLGAATDHFSAGLALAERSDNRARIAELRRDLGISALQLGDLGGAQRHFDAYGEAASASDLQRADVLYWVGRSYFSFENYGLALEHFEEAERLVGTQNDALRGLILRDNGSALLELGRTGEALVRMREAAELLSGNRYHAYMTRAVLGHALVESGAYEEALAQFAMAEGVEDELEWSAFHWYPLHGEALAYWGMGDRDAAEARFTEAVSLIETLRDHLSDPDDRSFFVFDKVDVYDDFAAFLREQGRVSDAFQVGERARSRTLVDLLYSTQQARKLDLTNPVDRAIELARQVRAVEDELNREMAFGEGVDEADALRGTRAAYLRDTRSRAGAQYQQAAADIFGSQLLYTFDPVPADTIRAMLRADEAVVVYSLSDAERGSDASRGGSMAYVITPDGLEAVPLDVTDDEVREAVSFFRSAVENPSNDNFETLSRHLYASLIEPVRSVLPAGVRHLNVVPEGSMHYLPFAALMDDRGDYLVERYTVSVAPSASVLKLTRDRNPRQWSYMLLLGDPDGRLPGAREEALSIASQSPSRRHALIGADASQSMFESVASQYDVVHFATHARFENRAPWRSHLELHDGNLTVSEIGRLSLDAYLVTLSACETALSSGVVSDVPDGDEWVGFNQAFLAAGTPSVLASLWRIDDASSGALMMEFYDHLTTRDKAESLAAAQRSALSEAATSHPFYWAAFTIVGDPI
ncbi:MAG: CHAT domain-containing protein [Rhodothermales bacterium]